MNRTKTVERRAPAGYLTSEQAARILGLSAFSVKDYARRGLITSHRPYGPRGKVVFLENDLKEYLAACRRPARVEAEPEEER